MVFLTCGFAPPLVFGLFAAVLHAVSMPYPYDGLGILTLPEERIANLSPYPPDYTGPVKMNTKLSDSAVRLFPEVVGSETVQTSPDGKTLYMLDRYGYLHTADLSGPSPKLTRNVTYVGPGRPLGFHLTADKKLLVCDVVGGLLEVDLADPLYAVRTLANTAPDGSRLLFANSLDVCPKTGKVYFTTSTERGTALTSGGADGYHDTMQAYVLNAMRGDATGRLFAYDPATRSLELLEEGIWFANGVAVSADGSFVYYCETSQFRVLRKCLVTGAVEVVIDRLPAYPDGLSRSPSGTFWVSLVAPTPPVVLLFRWPSLRMLMSHITEHMKKLALPIGLAAEIDADGTVLQSLGDPTGTKVDHVSYTQQVGKRLFFGNVNGPAVSYYDLE